MKQITELPSTEIPQHSVLRLEPFTASCVKLYHHAYADQARKLCSYGLSEIELADWFGTDQLTIARWKAKHSEFSQAINLSQISADANVVAALYRRAVGYETPALHVSSHKGKVTKMHYTKHVPACVTACVFWLKNRRPQHWGSLSETITVDGRCR